MIALDLFVAIMTADLSNAEMIALTESLLWTYGPKKRRDFHLEPPDLSHYCGLGSNNLRDAIRALVNAGILLPVGDGAYRFAKNYEDWHPRGRPFVDRLKGGLLRYARSAISRFGSPRIGPAKSSRREHHEAHRPAGPHSNRSARDPLNALQPECGDTPTGVPVTPSTHSNRSARDPLNALQPECGAYKVRDAEELRLERRERENTPLPPEGGAVWPPIEVVESTNPTPERNPGPGINSPEADALATWSDPLGGNWGYWARSQCQAFPAPWIRALLENQVLGRSPQPRQSYLAAILRRWKEQGSCDLARAAEPATGVLGPLAGRPEAVSRSARTSDLVRQALAQIKEGHQDVK